MNKKGFTLTELIVVIVIIGLVLLIVIPVSSNIMQNNAEEKCTFYVETLENAVKTYCDMYNTDTVTYSELESEGLFNNNSNGVSSDELTDVSFQISNGEVKMKKLAASSFSTISLIVKLNENDYIYNNGSCTKSEN